MPVNDHYQHHETGLLRATAESFAVSRWPDPGDAKDCRSWLAEAWVLPGVAEAIRHATPGLAGRVDEIISDQPIAAADVCRAALSIIRYLQRMRGRPTPFGTFSGVGTVSIGPTARVTWGAGHKAVARAETRWLHAVLDRIEQCPEVLARLDIVINDEASTRAGRWELPRPQPVDVELSPAVVAVREAAAAPVQFRILAEKLQHAFPHAGDPAPMLMSLVSHGFLLTSLRPPSTITDPLGEVVNRLWEIGATATPIAPLAHALVEIHLGIETHNQAPSMQARAELAKRMRAIVDLAREPLSIDLRLQADVQLPRDVAREMQRAAGVLTRLVGETAGSRAWREYFGAFRERFGTGTLVPLRDVIDPHTGIGFPRGYPDNPTPGPRHVLTTRDDLLLGLANRAAVCGHREIELDDNMINRIAATTGHAESIPPHIDLGARIHATSRDALDRGEYSFTVAPSRAAGTLTSRLTTMAPEAALADVIAALPTTTAGATLAQLSFPAIYPYGENVSRVPAYLTAIVSVGEHPRADAIRVDDLAVVATTRRLHLVTLHDRRIVEPQVLHALAPKQQPPLARLIGELPRALDVGSIGFNWGAAEFLPFRPRLRYGKAILSSARWRLTLADLPTDVSTWHSDLRSWRTDWRCPARVELRDFDQSLPLHLGKAAHREILFRHLRKNESALLVETPDVNADDWLDGHAHTVVLPMTRRAQPLPSPAISAMPVLGRDHGQLPGGAGSSWLYAKLFVPAERMNRFIADDLPALRHCIGDRPSWFVRYPQLTDEQERDHLRLRIRVDGDAGTVVAAITAWADQLRGRGALARLTFDTYFPENGRYVAIAEAEEVFVADSRLVLDQLTNVSAEACAPTVLTGLTMFDIAAAFHGCRHIAARWLNAQAPTAVPDRADVTKIVTFTRAGQGAIPGWAPVADAHSRLERALSRYRDALPDDADHDRVLRSLLHMHHNRAFGADREREARCLRLARQAAATWRAIEGQP